MKYRLSRALFFFFLTTALPAPLCGHAETSFKYEDARLQFEATLREQEEGWSLFVRGTTSHYVQGTSFVLSLKLEEQRIQGTLQRTYVQEEGTFEAEVGPFEKKRIYLALYDLEVAFLLARQKPRAYIAHQDEDNYTAVLKLPFGTEEARLQQLAELIEWGKKRLDTLERLRQEAEQQFQEAKAHRQFFSSGDFDSRACLRWIRNWDRNLEAVKLEVRQFEQSWLSPPSLSWLRQLQEAARDIQGNTYVLVSHLYTSNGETPPHQYRHPGIYVERENPSFPSLQAALDSLEALQQQYEKRKEEMQESEEAPENGADQNQDE